MPHTITRAVVIGSGTMGGGIAAHFANAGIPVYLLDITKDVVKASFDRMKKNKPAAFHTARTADLVTIGSLDKNEAWIAEGDWIIEAIVENIDAKRELVAKIDRLRKKGSIVSSNTSGLPIASISSEASEDFKKHFIGTHFFNPPRYMKLLEVIPTPDTDPGVINFVREFAESRLGKSVVLCKDTPNFIANRLASVGGATLVDFALANDYTIEETDSIAGPLIGRPKTAAFRLQDLVGLDIASAVASNLHGLIPDDETRDILASPRVEALRKSQTDKNRLGDKTAQGFYKKGGKEILSVDLKTGEYRARLEPSIPSIAEGLKIKSLPERLKFVLAQDDKAGAMARHVVYNALGYASRRVPEISDDLPSIDRAVRWGFSHDFGPFETWDILGVAETVEAMEKNGASVAPWVKEMLTAGNTSFYRDGRVYSPVSKSYEPLPHDAREIDVKTLPVVQENKSASLRDMGDGVLLLEFHSKMNTLDADIRALLNESIDELERGDWKALVIGNQGADFCVGANLKNAGSGFSPTGPAEAGPSEKNVGSGFSPTGPAEAGPYIRAAEDAVKATQDALMKVRFAAKPVVTAPFARTLGGGAEVAMAGARIVAASETYMGLVEVGVGLIPGAGGCKELVRRVVSPPMQQTPNVDVLPFVQSVLQTIGTAKVSTSGDEARELGFLTAGDRVVMNREHLLHEAKQEALLMAEEGYVPPVRDRNCWAGGRDIRAALKAAIFILQQSGYASEYDAFVSNKLAHILAGGGFSSGQWVDEQHFLDLERQAFVELLQQPKTMERIQYMLSNGKPLRN